ncbi:MAG: ribosome silencing factor [Ruminococcus sp.]|nr:ribosome silencing factor [Ruminococcus sp.]
METKEQARLIAKVLNDKKGIDVKVIKISDVSVLADYMVIATGTSSTHVKSLADEVEYQLDEAGFSVSHIEGHRGNGWILLDYIDIIVHIFDDDSREYYDLERLWQDGTVVEFDDID